jgi:hypothetical protein
MSPAFRAHPEFGYFCPSRGFRRRLLATLAILAVGALACAVVVGGGRDSHDASSTPGSVDAASSNPASGPAADQAIAAVAKPGPTESLKAVCEGETWTYLDGKCIAGKAQKPKTAAIDSAPIAAIPLGRTAPPPASPAAKAERTEEANAASPAPKPERVAQADAAPPPSESQRASGAVVTAPATAEPVVQSPSASKERRKASRERASRDERRSARTASSDNRKPRSATGWTKQVRSAEQLMRVLFSSGI